MRGSNYLENSIFFLMTPSPSDSLYTLHRENVYLENYLIFFVLEKFSHHEMSPGANYDFLPDCTAILGSSTHMAAHTGGQGSNGTEC